LHASAEPAIRRTRAEMPAFEEDIQTLIEEGIQPQLLAAPTRILAEGGAVRIEPA